MISDALENASRVAERVSLNAESGSLNPPQSIAPKSTPSHY